MSDIWRKRIADLFLIVGVLFLIWLGIKYFFYLLFPIASAWLFSEAIRNSLKRLDPLSPPVKRILIILVLMIFFALLSLVAVLITERTIHFISTLAEALSANSSRILSFWQEKITLAEEWIGQWLHRDLGNSMISRFPQMMESTLESLLARLPDWIRSLAESVPRFFLSLFIFILSTYYFSCDWENVCRWADCFFSREKQEGFRQSKRLFLRALGQFSKAWATLFLITFAELAIGLFILKIPGAFLKAFLIALIDILPILGCGTVLLPWSAILFLIGDPAKAAGILILYLIIFVIRQFAEPKIVGSSIGLHPILSLILVVLGLSLFGVTGMILLPLFVSCLMKSIDFPVQKH